MKDYLTLKTNALPGDIDIHSDLLSVLPSALSRKRALKAGNVKQEEMVDDKPDECFLCKPESRAPGSSTAEAVIEERVHNFINDFPYLPADQRVIFLWHRDEAVRRRCLHRYKLRDLRRMELYWLLKGCIQCGTDYKTPGRARKQPDLLRQAPNLMRMVVGFNLGKLAGQSIPHFHIQYG